MKVYVTLMIINNNTEPGQCRALCNVKVRSCRILDLQVNLNRSSYFAYTIFRGSKKLIVFTYYTLDSLFATTYVHSVFIL